MGNFWSKKSEEVATDVVQATAEQLFKEYSELKGKEYEIKKRKEEIIETIKELADANNVWKGKTARFNQFALEKKDSESLVCPDTLDIEDYRLQGYIKPELDKKRILKDLVSNEDLRVFFEVEIKTSYIPKGF